MEWLRETGERSALVSLRPCGRAGYCAPFRRLERLRKSASFGEALRNVAVEDVNVEMWKYGKVKVWKSGNARYSTLSCSSTIASGGNNACGEDSRQFFRLVNESRHPMPYNISAFHDDLEPNPRFGKFLHGDFHLVDEILSRFRFRRFGIVCGNTRGGSEQLVGKVAATNPLCRQDTTYLNASCGELHDPVFKFGFHASSPFSYYHNSIFSQFHNFTLRKIKPFTSSTPQQPIVEVASIDIYDCSFDSHKKMLGSWRTKTPRRLPESWRVKKNLFRGSVRIIANRGCECNGGNAEFFSPEFFRRAA